MDASQQIDQSKDSFKDFKDSKFLKRFSTFQLICSMFFSSFQPELRVNNKKNIINKRLFSYLSTFSVQIKDTNFQNSYKKILAQKT